MNAFKILNNEIHLVDYTLDDYLKVHIDSPIKQPFINICQNKGIIEDVYNNFSACAQRGYEVSFLGDLSQALLLRDISHSYSYEKILSLLLKLDNIVKAFYNSDSELFEDLDIFESKHGKGHILLDYVLEGNGVFDRNVSFIAYITNESCLKTQMRKAIINSALKEI